MDYRVGVEDSFIQRHHKLGDIYEHEIDRREDVRDYYSDACDTLEIAIDILTEKMEEDDE